MSHFQIKGFNTLADVKEALATSKGRLAFIAGGTDFINEMRDGGMTCDMVIDLSHVKDMKYIREEGDRIRIGAGTTFAEIASSRLIQEEAGCLAEAASQIGSVQIRNRATIGGNIATASPAADSVPPLTVLGATADLIQWGESIKDISGRHIDVCGTELAVNELITEVVFSTPPSNCRTGFLKLGSRSSVSVSKLNMAMRVHYNEETGTIEEGVIALGALGEEPVCPDDLRDFLADQKVDKKFATELIERLVYLVDGAIEGRASRPYKMSAIRGLGEDMLEKLFGHP